MSLLRLLAVGRSLSGIGGPSTRYRLTQESFLPKFSGQASLANAFECAVEPSGICPERPRSSMPETSATKSDVSINRPTKSEGIDRKPIQIAPTQQMSSKSDSSFLKRLFKRRSPFGSDRRLVQGELSLDAVKVLRNDLSEMDSASVCLVNAPSAAKALPVGQNSSGKPFASKRTKWSELTVKLFEAGRSRFS
jgi:hypothetical protein